MAVFLVFSFLLSIQLFISYFWVHSGIYNMLLPSKPWIIHLINYISWGQNFKLTITLIWIILIILLSAIQIYLFSSKILTKFSLKKLFVFAFIAALISSFSYNFLSSDIFTYLFAGKIATFFHTNPYLVLPKHFVGQELWLQFTLWIDKVYYFIGPYEITYRYGPVFLFYSLIPFFIFTANRFLGVYFGLKILNLIVFMLCGWLLLKINKFNKKIFAVWFFNPLLLLELLVNSHNDLLMIFLFFLAVFLISLKQKKWGIIAFILSIATKFATAPLFFIFFTKEKIKQILFKIAGFGILFYFALNPLYSWYYSWVYLVFPFTNVKKRTWILFFILQLILIIIQYHRLVLENKLGSLIWLPLEPIIRWGIPALMLVSEIYKDKSSVKIHS